MKKTGSINTKDALQKATIELLTDATWNFSHSVLWNAHPFSESTIQLSKKFIREYYENVPKELFPVIARYFSRYCERVLLAKTYVSRYPHRYIPHPCVWLNGSNPKGFAGTKAWLERIRIKRRLKNSLLSSEIYAESLLLNAKPTRQF